MPQIYASPTLTHLVIYQVDTGDTSTSKNLSTDGIFVKRAEEKFV